MNIEIVSPLIHKQAILFAIRKRMIGRRAYTDSLCSEKVKSSNREGTDGSTRSSKESSPKSTGSLTSEELEAKTFAHVGC